MITIKFNLVLQQPSLKKILLKVWIKELNFIWGKGELICPADKDKGWGIARALYFDSEVFF
ncbi:MAG: hypothetical protein CM15mP65_18190 [Crocinitomicaceae bacterium]|nr:MAG: hypothetical protein CM15mP65_18190 [Crocinitomicaceae bacterium]